MKTRIFVIREDEPRVKCTRITVFIPCSSPPVLIHAYGAQRSDQLFSPLSITLSILLLLLAAPLLADDRSLAHVEPRRMHAFCRKFETDLVVGRLVILLLDQPVLDNRGGGARGSGLLALNLDGHGLVLLQAAGEVGLLGRLGGLGGGEGLDLTDGVGLLDGSGLVGLELLQVELLDKVGCDTLVSLVNLDNI